MAMKSCSLILGSTIRFIDLKEIPTEMIVNVHYLVNLSLRIVSR